MKFLLAVAGVAAAIALGACGSSSASMSAIQTASRSSTATTAAKARAPKPRPPRPSFPRLLPSASGSNPTPFVPAVKWANRTAAWVARSASGVALLSFDQRIVSLHLHSGTVDAGRGMRWGPDVNRSERRRLVAAFNGGFKLATGAGGFVSYGRVGVPLRDGLGSIVTYADGSTDIGSWHGEVPTRGQRVVAVRQNLTLLIDRGQPAGSVTCDSCWGATLHSVPDPARSAIGVTPDGRLIWAGGEHLTVRDLVSALQGAHVVRAVELDINPEWVNGYLYGHRGGAGPLAPVPIVPGQSGVAGQFLAPYSRDFFTVLAR